MLPGNSSRRGWNLSAEGIDLPRDDVPVAERYVRAFDAKWLRSGVPVGEALVGSGNIQSLADLGNSFELVQAMRAVPVPRDAVIQTAAATLAPIWDSASW